MQFLKNIWLKFFSKQPEPLLDQLPTLDSNFMSSLSMTCKSDGGLELISLWDTQQQTDEMAYIYGTALRNLTNGNYDTLIIKSLVQLIKENPKIKPEFVELVVATWKSDEIQEYVESQQTGPIVSPLRTFGESNFGRR